MSKTLFVSFRDNGFWAFDVVSAVFLKHLIDAATTYLERHNEAWLLDAVAKWRVNAVISDLGLFLDDSWSPPQLDTFTALAIAACDSLAKRDQIPAEEIESWEMADGLRCFARGLSAVSTASAIRLGEAVVKLVNSALPDPPAGTWWFFFATDAYTTIRKRGQ